MKSLFFLVLIILCGSTSVCHTAFPKSGRGARASSGPWKSPLATTAPNLPGGKIASKATRGPFFQDFQPPFPTDTWWAAFTVVKDAKSQQDVRAAGPFPFTAQTTNQGLNFGISDTRLFSNDGRTLHVDPKSEWNVFPGDLPDDLKNRKAVAWDTQVLCLQYFTNSGNKMDSCLVPGSPYMTLTFTNATVNIQSVSGDISSFQWINKGKKAKVATRYGGTYFIYVVRGKSIDLTPSGKRALISPAGFSGTLRFAKVTAEGQEVILDRHAETYATGVTLAYTVANDVATTTWTWDVVGNAADLLILSWPHHRKTIQGAKFTDIQYLTLKGQMKGVVGNKWTFKHQLPTISWFAQSPPQPSCLNELNKTLDADVKRLYVRVPNEYYFWGGSFARDARLALIAEHAGRTDLIQSVVNVLKDSINNMFNTSSEIAATYETVWGGVINKKGWNNTVDGPDGFFNDHHFLLGYLLYGAAVIGKYDPAWLQKNRDFLMHVARNIANPSPSDPHYTVTRHMDFFCGHSWASGLADGAGERGQESSGEAVNAYYALSLFGQVIKNQALVDYGRYLVAIEIEGAQTYWHLYPNRNDPDTPYPEQRLRDFVTAGIVKATQVGAWLLFGYKKDEGWDRIKIAAMQILPLTPIGQLTYDAPWMEQVVPYCQQEINNASKSDDWKSVITAAYAKFDPQEAYVQASNMAKWGSGNSASNNLYFIATQPSSKDICTDLYRTLTPEGLFTIQDAFTGKFVYAQPNGFLVARFKEKPLATKFSLAYMPGGGTIQTLANKKYVAASPYGNTTVVADRNKADEYELFRWAKQTDGTFLLTAMVNKQQVRTTAGNGALFNDAGPLSKDNKTPSSYRLAETRDFFEEAPPPARGLLQSVETGKFVAATAKDTTLRAIGNAAGEGTGFLFDKMPDSPYYSIKSEANKYYVTGDPEGKKTLNATAWSAKGWEAFQIVRRENQSSFFIVHVASGNLATLQMADGTIIAKSSDNVDNSNTWNILP